MSGFRSYSPLFLLVSASVEPLLTMETTSQCSWQLELAAVWHSAWRIGAALVSMSGWGLESQGRMHVSSRVMGVEAAVLTFLHGAEEICRAKAGAPTMMGNTVFLSFTFYSTILILKMYVVAIITGQVRLRKKAFANPEDALRNGGLQYYREDPDVERCRRAHRNDMENIFPFLFLGAVYSLLDPSPAVARIHFFIFCAGRIMHTVAYLLKLRAPTRSVAYSVAQLPCFSMALQILLAAAPYW
ncbi:prostaglandin E synthase isoform X1 [Meleagris gallopavo]|uniref:Prostaglandin E synthase n=2 Tax=Meleagris gallopavo TaxID=9103 RepID=A0A803XUI4_MELGA|nr:prostaglandin E synthase isoform X1 [Meleagris gallopavo]